MNCVKFCGILERDGIPHIVLWSNVWLPRLWRCLPNFGP